MAGPLPDAWLWMGAWGLPNQSASRFLLGRSMRMLRGEPAALRVPTPFARQAYNPSIVALPAALRAQLGCPGCAFAATVRIDWMTQCNGFSGLLRDRLAHSVAHSVLRNRKATLFMLLDPDLLPVRWGWLQSKPNRRAAFAKPLSSAASLSLALRIVDVRLFLVEGQLWASGTFPNHQYDSAVSMVHIQTPERHGPRASGAGATLDENVGRLVAWIDRKELLWLREPRGQGRSQAFFAAPSGDEHSDHGSNRGAVEGRPRPPTLLFQSWLLPDVIFGVSTGSSRFARRCAIGAACAPVRSAAVSPLRARLEHETAGPQAAADALVAAGSCAEAPSSSTGAVRGAASRCRLSLNGLLIYIDEWKLLLGMAHLHRGHRDTLDGQRLPQNLTYFAHHYTHYFYALDPQAPHAVRSLGTEFCIGSERRIEQGPGTRPATVTDCEIIQYVSGMTRTGQELLISYGVNDCEARTIRLLLSDVQNDLSPL